MAASHERNSLMKYGRLTFLRETEPVAKRPAYLCQCECGNVVAVQRKKLLTGHTQSCGCLQKQRSMENVKIGHALAKTHGLSGTKEYQAWLGMKSRVTYENPKSGQYYIEKGITVCREWMKDFESFFAYIGVAPSKSHSVDRIDSNGNYEPGNVKWSTDMQQNRNKGDNVVIPWRGQERLLIEVVEEVNLPYQTVWYRLKRAKWDVERALTTPVKQNWNNITMASS